MTNRDWLESLSNEQLANYMIHTDHCDSCVQSCDCCDCECVENIGKWLEEEHE